MSERVGVFVCDCGSNIADTVDTNAAAAHAGGQEEVVAVKLHRLWCSEEGRREMAQAISENHLSRVVVAACSPKQHEATFRKVLAGAGINPYLLAMVNIREQVAWVTKDKQEATLKAQAQITAAIRRVRLQQPLEETEIECKNDFLVVGAGVAGMSAALALAQKNRRVYLLEKSAWIGGNIVCYEDVFPNMECAPCMMEPKEDEVLHHERITLLTNSELQNVKGFFGNFEVQMLKKARLVDMDKCIGCGACYDACPVTVKNTCNGGLSERHAIWSKFPGALPNAPVIDRSLCLRYNGKTCTKCQEACPFMAIDYGQKDDVVIAAVGGIVVATGSTLYDVSSMKNFSPDNPNVITSFQLERLLSSSGPTEGKLLKPGTNEPPKSIAFIHCAGSRTKQHKEYCSGICCAYTLKQEHLARKKCSSPDLKLYGLFSDWCLGGKGYQEFHDRMEEHEQVNHIRVDDPNAITVTVKEDGSLSVNYGAGSIVVDMVVLAPPIVPAEDASSVAAAFGLSLDKNGFFIPEHEKIMPATTTTRGVYIAGTACGPKDVTQAVAQAQAAAGMALSALVPGEKISLEVATAEVQSSRCGGCRTCVSMCPYQAISFDDEKNVALVNQILCHGCGVCASTCPAGAIENRHFTNAQIFAEIEGVLK